jgi:S-adenosylmethionine-dependent methyltransferase
VVVNVLAKNVRPNEHDIKMSMAADERFLNGARDYAAYLDTPEGRLRTDLAFDNLKDFLPATLPGNSLRVLDVGSGTGVTAVRLARLGMQVTLLDSSPSMLEIAKRAAEDEGLTDKIVLQQGDAERLADFPAESFDVILCHNVLEYLDDPITVLRGAARALRDSSAILSVLVRNRAGEVFKSAVQKGDLAVAESSLTAEWGEESLYRGRIRLFTPDSLHAMLEAASLGVIGERGVRVVSDYLPSQISRVADYERILQLERKLSRRSEYAGVARYVQCMARLG